MVFLVFLDVFNEFIFYLIREEVKVENLIEFFLLLVCIEFFFDWVILLEFNIEVVIEDFFVCEFCFMFFVVEIKEFFGEIEVLFCFEVEGVG